MADPWDNTPEEIRGIPNYKYIYRPLSWRKLFCNHYDQQWIGYLGENKTSDQLLKDIDQIRKNPMGLRVRFCFRRNCGGHGSSLVCYGEIIRSPECIKMIFPTRDEYPPSRAYDKFYDTLNSKVTNSNLFTAMNLIMWSFDTFRESDEIPCVLDLDYVIEYGELSGDILQIQLSDDNKFV